MKTVIRHLRRAALLQEGSGPTDARLLEMFSAGRDEAAFEALMRRHGPMVLGVCRRVLRNAHDADDAFQATFLVFIRKAGSLRSRELLANWLYGVAYRTSMKARAMNAKRRTKERQATEVSRPASEACEELVAKLDHELSRLPDKYRAPIILCELEGKSRKDVAHLLGLPEGTLSWRLAHAKKTLARRLSRYGTVALVTALSESASTCLTPTLRATTLKTAMTAGAVPAKVLALTEGVMKAMLLTKNKITTCAAVLMMLAGVGASGLTYRAAAQSPKPKETQVSLSQADEMDALRLEIEALRKELRATKERVKALEDQGRSQKGAGAGEAFQNLAKQNLDDWVRGVRMTKVLEKQGESRRAKFASELRSRAELALKKFGEQTDDKQAVELLEQALKLLKEREEQNLSGPRDRRIPVGPKK
jgi:RNA polymerase sigma factor (sigma-70 family)